MKKLSIISFLSIMITTFAIAEETPKTPGISVHDMFKLRQMWDDLQNNSKKDFSLRMRPNEICFKNNERNEEVCIHKAILAEMFLEAYKQNDARLLAKLEQLLIQFKQTNLPEFNVDLQVNNPPVQFDKNDQQIIDPKNKPQVRLAATTPTGSFKAESNSLVNSPGEININQAVHVQDKFDVTVAAVFDPSKGNFIDYLLHMKNLEPRKK